MSGEDATARKRRNVSCMLEMVVVADRDSCVRRCRDGVGYDEN